MSSEIDFKNFIIVLKKIQNQKERNNQFKQLEDYVVKQALSLMKSNGLINNNYGKNNKSHSNDSYMVFKLYKKNNSNVIFSQSGNDKIFTFIKSVIDYCNSKCSNQVIDSFVDLVEVYNNELKLNTAQMIDWKQYILSYLFTFLVSTPQLIKGVLKKVFKKFGSNAIIKMIVYEKLNKFSKIISSNGIMSSFRSHVKDLSELLVERVNESFSENSNIEIILRILELCGTNFGEISSIEILSHAIKYLSYESPQLDSSNILEEGEELESESDTNYLSYIKIIWKLKIAFELKCPNVLSNCIKDIFEELPNMSDDEIKSLFQRFNLLLEVNDYLPKDHPENSKNIFSNSNQWKQIYQYINHNNVEIVIQSYKLLSKCLPNNILPCEKFQICSTLITNYFNYLRKRIICNLPNTSGIKPKLTITNNELIQMFSSITNCLIRLLENSNYIGPTLDILFQEIFCKVDINPLNEALNIQKMKTYLDEIDDLKKVKKKETHGYSLFEANLIMCEQLKAQQESNINKNNDTKKRILAPSNLTESNRTSVFPIDLKKRSAEPLSLIGLNKKVNSNKDSLYSIKSEKNKSDAKNLSHIYLKILNIMDRSNNQNGFLQDIYLLTDQLQSYDINKNNDLRHKENRNAILHKNVVHHLNNKRNVSSNKKNILKPSYPNYPSSQMNSKAIKPGNIHSNQTINRNPMYEIQQFCLDIKNSKKQQRFNNDKKKSNVPNTELTETILLNESEEMGENNKKNVEYTIIPNSDQKNQQYQQQQYQQQQYQQQQYQQQQQQNQVNNNNNNIVVANPNEISTSSSSNFDIDNDSEMNDSSSNSSSSYTLSISNDDEHQERNIPNTSGYPMPFSNNGNNLKLINSLKQNQNNLHVNHSKDKIYIKKRYDKKTRNKMKKHKREKEIKKQIEREVEKEMNILKNNLMLNTTNTIPKETPGNSSGIFQKIFNIPLFKHNNKNENPNLQNTINSNIQPNINFNPYYNNQLNTMNTMRNYQDSSTTSLTMSDITKFSGYSSETENEKIIRDSSDKLNNIKNRKSNNKNKINKDYIKRQSELINKTKTKSQTKSSKEEKKEKIPNSINNKSINDTEIDATKKTEENNFDNENNKNSFDSSTSNSFDDNTTTKNINQKEINVKKSIAKAPPENTMNDISEEDFSDLSTESIEEEEEEANNNDNKNKQNKQEITENNKNSFDEEDDKISESESNSFDDDKKDTEITSKDQSMKNTEKNSFDDDDDDDDDNDSNNSFDDTTISGNVKIIKTQQQPSQKQQETEKDDDWLSSESSSWSSTNNQQTSSKQVNSNNNANNNNGVKVIKKVSDSPTTSIVSISEVGDFSAEEESNNEVSVIKVNKNTQEKEDNSFDDDDDDDESNWDSESSEPPIKKEEPPKPKIIKNTLFDTVDKTTVKMNNNEKKQQYVDDINEELIENSYDDDEESSWDSHKSEEEKGSKPKVTVIKNNLFNDNTNSIKKNNDEATNETLSISSTQSISAISDVLSSKSEEEDFDDSLSEIKEDKEDEQNSFDSSLSVSDSDEDVENNISESEDDDDIEIIDNSKQDESESEEENDDDDENEEEDENQDDNDNESVSEKNSFDDSSNEEEAKELLFSYHPVLITYIFQSQKSDHYKMSEMLINFYHGFSTSLSHDKDNESKDNNEDNIEDCGYGFGENNVLYFVNTLIKYCFSSINVLNGLMKLYLKYKKN
ncbi:hypothetical protein PIROE2DRAFT_63376 [Piromyces sp. E2]|nr:hypothetical protein PIROE2DRAFT_63376 [Piromyces sp. E2]|eukprot:OUM60049.1 hypothetical protein PIROE2DRAFT_63376 [Piromyces sp. E2]